MRLWNWSAELCRLWGKRAGKTKQTDQSAGAVSQADLAGAGAGHGPKAYPFCLPFLAKGFDLSFDRAVTIVVGENGVGKSTLLEGIAALAGYDQAGGARDTCRSIIPTRSMFQAPTFRMRCGQAGCPKYQGLVLPRGEFFLGRALSGLGRERGGGFPLAFAR